MPAAALGHEQDVPAVGVPGRIVVPVGVAGEASLAGAVRAHDVDLGVSVAVTRKNNLFAVGREAGANVLKRTVGQTPHVPAVCVGDVNLEIAVTGRTKYDP